MKGIKKGILLLSLVSISFGLNITSNKNSNELKLSSFSNKRISKANINADSKLKATLLDGGDASDRYEVKEKGYGCISTVITSPGDYLITQVDTFKAGEYKLGFKATDKYGVSQEKYVTIKVIKKRITIS